jgi:uncharacterized protein Yka (UPF0111/DUF47 family)
MTTFAAETDRDRHCRKSVKKRLSATWAAVLADRLPFGGTGGTMGNVWDAFSRFFGSSHNDRYAALLKQLAETGVECAAHFKATDGQDLPGVVVFERKADKFVDEIHELLDNSFIMRFDIPDAMRLTDEIDNVIDRMRHAASHIDTYKAILSNLRPEAKELIAEGERTMKALRDLVALIGEQKMPLSRVRELQKAINESEGAADLIINRAERRLVTEFSPATANHLEYIAWDKLYQLLEEMTDDAKRCGKLILSLARKEA